MTSTLTKAKEAVTRRSRLEVVDEAIAADEAKLDAARRQFVELVEVEDEAVRQAKAKDALASPYKLGSPAQTARTDRDKLERSIEGLEKGLAALGAERVTAAREAASRQLVDRTEQARDLRASERSVRLAAGEVLAELAAQWEKLAPVLEQRSELLAQVRSAQLVDQVGADSEEAARWEAAAGYIVTPVPTTFAAFVDELLEAALAERTDVAAEYAEIDAQNERRRAIAATNPGGDTDLPPIPYPVIPENPLDELVPLLHPATAQVAGVETRRSRPDLAW